jgi:predicted NBD/HSP70 family sugar kinase
MLLGIDLGGTNCRAALADHEGEIHAEISEPTVRSGSAAALVEQFASLAQRAAASRALDYQVKALAVAIPGFVDPGRGVIGVLPNLFGNARDIPLRTMLEQRFAAPAAIENDVKTAAIGELRRGWGRRYSSFIFVGMGTGTSSAVVLDGKLHRGQSGQAGEIAYALTGREYLGQDFGESGCLETHISGYGLALQYSKRTGITDIEAAAVFERAARGDAVAREVIDEGLDHLAVGLSGAVTLLDPQALIFGGSIGLRSDVLAGMERRLRSALPLFSPALVASQLGKSAQLVGAIESARALLSP